jgi:hypothetical protein
MTLLRVWCITFSVIGIFIFLCGIEHLFGIQIFPYYCVDESLPNSPASGVVSLIGGLIIFTMAVVGYVMGVKKPSKR